MPTPQESARPGYGSPDPAVAAGVEPSAPLPIAASAKEEALWLLDAMVPGSAVNNLSLAFELEGTLSPTALEQALAVLLRRHEALRTVFRAVRGQLEKTVTEPGCARIPLELFGADADPAGFVARAFAFDGSPLIRAGLFRRPSGDVFCLVAHHLIFDARSGAVLLPELVAAYEAIEAEGRAPATLRVAVPRPAEPAPSPEGVAYWKRRLAGLDPASTILGCGRPEGAAPDLAGDRILHPLSAQSTTAVRDLAKQLRAPEAVLLLAAYLLLLEGHGAGPDLVVGSPVNVRPREAADSIGYLINVLPLRVGLDRRMSGRELVRTVREVFLDALAHADVPVDGLAELQPRAGGSWRRMLFQHLFNYTADVTTGEFTVCERTARPLPLENGCSKFDLEFFVLSDAADIRIRAVFRPQVLDRPDVSRMLERYEALILELAAAPDRPLHELTGWSARDRAVIDAANETAGPVHPVTVLDGFAAHAAARPRATAIVDEGGGPGPDAVDYRCLWDSAAAAAARLAEAGVGDGDVVVVAGRRGAATAAAVLGIWLAGATYLPVDPRLPAERRAYHLSDSAAVLVLTDSPEAFALGDGPPVLPLPPLAAPGGAGPLPPVLTDPESCAYLMYTSGSTGLPKGTLVSHRSLANLCAHFAEELRLRATDAALWLTAFTFDISGLELFTPLLAGGRVITAPDEARADGRVLSGLLERHPGAVVQATPTTWRLVLDRTAPLLAGRRVLCGGEPAPESLVRGLLATGCELHHVYGPTETTIWSTSQIVPPDSDGPLCIGGPIRNTRVAVLGADGRDLPVGLRGELAIAGAGVALGYLGRPELTAERFVEHPRHGRSYRTGDLARWRADGTVELLGRADRQIKLRGHRIELGEVESAVLRHPDVKAAAVVVAGDRSGDGRLVAFVEAGRGDATDPGCALAESLASFARDALPQAARPQEYVVLAALPTNSSAKVDYPALTRLADELRGAARTQTDVPVGAAVRDLVDTLTMLWRDLLERRDAAADTDFFEAGGHSLLGALLVQRIQEATGLEVPLAALFADPTPLRLAERFGKAGT